MHIKDNHFEPSESFAKILMCIENVTSIQSIVIRF